MASRPLILFVFSLLLLGGSTDLAAQRSEPVGVRNSRDSTAARDQAQPDLACAARRVAVVGGGAFIGMAMGRLIYAIGNLLSSDHGSIYRRGQHRSEVRGAILGGAFNALMLVVVRCDQLASGSDPVTRPPKHAGFH